MEKIWSRVRNLKTNEFEWICVHGIYHQDNPDGCVGECDGCCKNHTYPGRKVI